jgi:predicted amidohydrolase YtcJ
MIASSCRHKQRVDMILHNANIYTVDSAFSMAEAMAVSKGRIMAVGSNEEIMQRFISDSLVDAEGAAVFPGFIDAHCHFLGYGLQKRNADLRGTASFAEVLKRLKQHYDENPQPWLLGRGWDQNDWAVKEFPDKEKLDSLFPETPVFITRIDGHAALANSKALEIAGIRADTKIEGGEVLLKNGHPSGMLLDNAMELVNRKIPKVNAADKEAALKRAEEDCFAAGLTTVADAGLACDEVQLIDCMQREGKLRMRIYAMLNPDQENENTFISKGPYQTERLNVCSIKAYADGALGSRGACLLKPYSDDPGNEGIMVTGRTELLRLAELAYRNHYQLNVHAIGDSAVRTVLQVYAQVLKGRNDRRWRVEHAQVCDPADLKYFSEYSVIPSVQPTHATSDMYWAEERLGKERVCYAYAYKKLLVQNGWIAFGTDFPIEQINPILTFFAAVARRDTKGFPDGGWQNENAVGREEALKAMTIWAARACFTEDSRGSLEAGKWADFVILSDNIMKADLMQIPAIRPKAVYCSGSRVF